ECGAGKDAGGEYVAGTRFNVQNDRPIIAPYGVNADGSGDMYYKGGNMLHTIRQIVGDDAKWRETLRGLNLTFRHQTVTGAQVQQYISHATGVDLGKVFQQYLTTTDVPVLEYTLADSLLTFRWTKVVPGFDMPLRVTLGDSGFSMIRPTEAWQHTTVQLKDPTTFRVDPNYYVLTQHDLTAPREARH
ncbi:MAG TPA: hypothetical protein VFJ24_09180, partial [Gaiellales bacterium]|nr:hypothetical protein [Gaiellales bacterium]